jgi:serine/threonine-protein kinase
MIGQVIGNYRITGELARGGMGVVYRAQHLTLPREVVIKAILLGGFHGDAQEHLKARFLREAYVQSQMDHSHIVRVFEFFATTENYYLVMEYVPGMSLRDVLHQRGALPVHQALQIFQQVLAGMSYAHNFSYLDQLGNRHTGIVHRDIKPANILLDGQARAKITDFGIVKTGEEMGMTQTGFNPGTVEFMSPEQIKGEAIDARSDIYSLGITLYEMLAGRLPFEHTSTGSDYEIRRGHVEMAPPPIVQFRPELDTALINIVHRAISKKPAERFQTAQDFLEAILHYQRTASTADEAAPQAGTEETTPLYQQTAAAANMQVAAPAPKPALPPVPALPQTTGSSQKSAAGLLIGLGLLLVLLAGGGGAYWFFAGKSGATVTQTLPPVIKPAVNETPSVIDPGGGAYNYPAALSEAKASEMEERYAEAAKACEKWLNDNPGATEPDPQKIREQIARLKKLAGLLAIAKTEMDKNDFADAARDYEEALKIRPESKIAQEGLKNARARGKAAY